MRQMFMHLIASDSQLSRLTKRLEAAAFLVIPSRRASGGIHVRVRTETGDEAEVERIVAEVAPETKRGPGGAPTTDIKGYRQGR